MARGLKTTKSPGGNTTTRYRKSGELLGLDLDLVKKAPDLARFRAKRDKIMASKCERGPLLAKYVREFLAKYCCHSKGRWRGKPLKTLPWQNEFIDAIFGQVDRNGHRIKRTAQVWVPKKNGKSTILAGIGLYMLVADGEGSAEVYSCAADKEQASIVHGEALRMVQSSPELAKHLRINRTKSEIHFDATQSVYKALTAEAATKEGLSPSFLSFDELHVWKNSEMWDVFKYSHIARDQQLKFIISTAGIYDPESIGWQQFEYAKRVQSGEVKDPSTYAYVKETPKDADIQSPRTWREANPSYGRIIKPAEMRQSAVEAENNPRLESVFRRYRLNQWVENDGAWLAVQEWDECKSDDPPPAGSPCWAGLDLAAKEDLNALALLWKDSTGAHTVRFWFWLPRAGSEFKQRIHRVPLLMWGKQGLITFTEGEVVDYERIRADVRHICKQHKVRTLAFDPWGAHQMAQQLTKDRLSCVEYQQTTKAFNEPCMEFERLIESRTIRHDGNPVARWNLANTVLYTDSNGHVRPSKTRSRGKTDGAVALLMALGRCIFDDTPQNPYQDRGLLVL